MDALSPYREPGALASTKPKDTFGLIRAPKVHRCSPPGFWMRLLYRLFFRTIRKDSVFRCQCGRSKYFWRCSNELIGSWESCDKDRWVALGGDVADEDKKG